MMNLVIVTPPTEEPVSLANAKLQMRVDHTADDTLIGIIIAAAREQCEEISRRAFVTQTLRLSLDAWPCEENYISLPRPPLQSVTSVKYTDWNGAEYTLSASTDYLVDIDSEPGRVVLRSGAAWPGAVLCSAGAIKIIYVAGFGAATAVPKKYQQAVQILAAHFYENRETASPDSLSEIPFGVSALLVGDKGWA
jgi:uncharacterized phiE125 gp8 family phage protein